MDVSKNNGTPKSSHFNSVFHYFHHPFWGNYPYFLVQHPYISTHAVWVGWGETLSGGAHLLGSFLGRCNMVHGCSRLCQEVVSWRHHRSWSLILIPFSTPHPKIKNKSEKRNSRKMVKFGEDGKQGRMLGMEFSTQHPKIQGERLLWNNLWPHDGVMRLMRPMPPTPQASQKPPPLERSPGFWKLTSSLGGWMYTGIINSELWNFVVWIWINPACVCYEKLCFSLMDVMVRK